MHATRLHEFGPPENLRYEQVDDPRPGPGRVRIAVAAAGVHLLDTTIRAGRSGGPFPLPQLPMIPGREVAGVVDEVGDGVDGGWIGRRVVAHLGQASGGYAELAVREVESLHAIPDSVADETAVAMIGTGRTAMGVLEIAQPAAHDVVLVTAAAGGLGTLLVQAARSAGATVIGAAGGEAKVAYLRELGADLSVDYDRDGWDRELRQALGDREVSLVLDGVGGARGRTALELLGTGGRIVLIGWASGEPTQISAHDLYERGLTATAALGPAMLRRAGGIRGLEEASLAAAAAGTLRPTWTAFPLADAAAAHAAVEQRATTGKTILLP